ncbi:hypothetical protein B0537_03885 [Desulforamulus ferrireducens]|uniref:Uncharacterized protein n=1 Tax=Desulforamulus ferrireducens TaxID=1833852 RepID=A0A1S6IU94_9FIRM|nr:hypothetical protein B0537_03885 [Desulforamulus ferrireducens]
MAFGRQPSAIGRRLGWIKPGTCTTFPWGEDDKSPLAEGSGPRREAIGGVMQGFYLLPLGGYATTYTIGRLFKGQWLEA